MAWKLSGALCETVQWDGFGIREEHDPKLPHAMPGLWIAWLTRVVLIEDLTLAK